MESSPDANTDLVMEERALRRAIKRHVAEPGMRIEHA
jgi:hypothetical protein